MMQTSFYQIICGAKGALHFRIQLHKWMIDQYETITTSQWDKWGWIMGVFRRILGSIWDNLGYYPPKWMTWVTKP